MPVQKEKEKKSSAAHTALGLGLIIISKPMIHALKSTIYKSHPFLVVLAVKFSIFNLQTKHKTSLTKENTRINIPLFYRLGDRLHKTAAKTKTLIYHVLDRKPPQQRNLLCQTHDSFQENVYCICGSRCIINQGSIFIKIFLKSATIHTKYKSFILYIIIVYHIFKIFQSES